MERGGGVQWAEMTGIRAELAQSCKERVKLAEELEEMKSRKEGLEEELRKEK